MGIRPSSSYPLLTTLAQPRKQTGPLAVRVLPGCLRDLDLPPQLVARGSMAWVQ